MKRVTHVRVSDPIAQFAGEYAEKHFRKPADVIQEFMRRGMFEFQMAESKRRQG